MSNASRLCLVAALATAAVAALGASVSDGDNCNPDKLTVYKMVLHTYWTREKFPKHYPDWMPPAQWSKVYGVSHDASYVLFRLGHRVSTAVREFAESGRSETLGSAPGTMDVFGAPPIQQGAGRAEAEFYVDGNHSRVSAMARMVPSPDWFVGVDSFDLCVDGNWLDTITIEVDPVDAGTDNGFTFTAPNWPTAPQGVAYRITSRYPAHPAGSFFYPHLRRLPPVATFQFIKLREYEVSEVFHHASDERRYDVLQLDKMAVNSIDLLDGNRALSVAEEVERDEEGRASQPPRLYRDGAYRTTPDNTYYSLWNGSNGAASPARPAAAAASTTEEPRSANELSPDTSAMLHSLARRYRARRRRKHPPALPPSSAPPARGAHPAAEPDLRRKRKRARSLDCRVSGWSAWSACSGGCGVGEAVRTRRVVRRARRGGAKCPPLTQTRWCAPLNCTAPAPVPHVLT